MYVRTYIMLYVREKKTSLGISAMAAEYISVKKVVRDRYNPMKCLYGSFVFWNQKREERGGWKYWQWDGSW